MSDWATKLFFFGLILLALAGSAGAISCGTVPTSVSALVIGCYPVNILNTQTIATSVGFQQEFNGLPFNALVGNWVFYNGVSGALMPAWAENTGIIWANLEANVISASGSVNGNYYFGLGSPSTNFFISGNNVGEAPQSSTSYGTYDNGNTVFTFYDNFAGSVLSPLWTTSGTVNALVNNGFTWVGTGGASVGYMQSTTLYSSGIIDMLGYFTGTGTIYSNGAVGAYTGFMTPNAFTTNSFLIGTVYSFAGISYQSCIAGICNGPVVTGTPEYVSYNIISIVSNSIAGGWAFNYIQSPLVTTDYPISNSMSIGIIKQNANGAAITLQWFRLRSYPPNGIMPQVIYGPTPVPILFSSITTPTPTVTQLTGNTISWTAAFTGGIMPYTYDWLISNTATGAILSNVLVSNSYLGNTFSWNIPFARLGSIRANVVIYDNYGDISNSVYSGSITVNTALVNMTISPTSATIPAGGSVTFTTVTVGGIGPFKETLSAYPSSSCGGSSIGVQTSTNIFSNIVTWTPVSPTVATYYCANIIDAIGQTANSIIALVTVTTPNINTTGPSVQTPKPVINCALTYNSASANEQFYCTGSDSTGLTTGWNLTLYNESSIQIPLVLAANFTGSTFNYLVYNAINISNVVAYTAIIRYTGTTQTTLPNKTVSSLPFTGIRSIQFPIQPITGFNSSLDGLIVFIMMMVFLAIGVGLAQTPGGQVHGISNTLFLLAFALFLCIMLGFMGGISILLSSGLIVFLLIMGMYVMLSENKSQYSSA